MINTAFTHIWMITYKMLFSVVAVKKVVSQLKPLLSKKKLLVSVAAGTKLKDLEVCEIEYFLHYANFRWIGLLSFDSQSYLWVSL